MKTTPISLILSHIDLHTDLIKSCLEFWGCHFLLDSNVKKHLNGYSYIGISVVNAVYKRQYISSRNHLSQKMPLNFPTFIHSNSGEGLHL